MPKQQKFHFIPAHQLNKPKDIAKLVVSFNPSIKLLSFNQKVNPEVVDFVGRYVMVFADVGNKTLAWTFAKPEWKKPEELKGYDPIRKYGSTIAIYVPKRICDALGMDKKFKKVEVGNYQPAEYLDSNLYYTVELNKINYGEEESE